MSLITRCPACETLFKVVPDQLRISDGWVRCGQCDEIFDASIHLLPDSPTVQPSPVDINVDLDTAETPEDSPIEPEQALPDTVELVAPADDPELDSLTALLAPHVTPVDSDGEEADSRVVIDDVSFLRDKNTNSFWRKPFMRTALGLLSLVLLLALAGQIVIYERDRIAASEPSLKPWLLALCGPLNCTLSPLRKIESLVIDSASFTKIRGDSYRLNFTVKNNALLPLALPAIELTLTDSLDQPVIRRVFLPEELGVKSDALAAGREWAVSLAMSVKAAGTADRVAGYRVLAFYP